MSMSHRSGARALEGSICLKYYIVSRGESRFTFGLDTTKNTHYIQKYFK